MRELLILADGLEVKDQVANLVANNPLHAGTKIRYVHITEGATIGEKRNLGSGLAAGSVVASWDDDDWSAPGRIEDQMRRLQAAGKAVTSYHSMFFTDGARWWKYSGSKLANLGTSLCYRKDWWQTHRFSSKHVNEDGDFIMAAARENQLISADAGNNMVASIHAENTSPRGLSGSNWKQIDRPDIPNYE